MPSARRCRVVHPSGRGVAAVAALLTAIPLFAAVAVATTSSDTTSAADVGRPLGGGTSLAVMEPVAVGARFTHVAAVAGSRDDETWATALVNRYPGSDVSRVGDLSAGSEAFYVYRRGDGWRFAGIPRAATGESLATSPDRGKFRFLAVSTAGEGWAVRLHVSGDEFFRLDRGTGNWIRDDAATAALNKDKIRYVNSLALGADETGTFGIAVVRDSDGDDTREALRYDGTSWTLETVLPGGVIQPPESSPPSTPPPSTAPPSSGPPSSDMPPSGSTPPSSAPPSSPSDGEPTIPAPMDIPSMLPSPTESAAPPAPAGPTAVETMVGAVASRDVAWIAGEGTESTAGVKGPKHPVVLRRSADGTWSRVPLGSDLFDTATPPADIAVRFLLADHSSTYSMPPRIGIAATDDDVWVTGVMDVVDLRAHPLGDTSNYPPAVQGQVGPTPMGRQSFAVHLHNGAPTGDYCPVVPRISPDGHKEPVSLCTHELPTRTEVSQVTVVDKSVVLTARTGLLVLDPTAHRFVRQPTVTTSVYESAFTAADEGWVTTYNKSPDSVVGHWTNTAAEPSFRRWATPAEEPLEAVAVAPSGGRTVAVGHNIVLLLTPGAGWDVLKPKLPEGVTSVHLHAVAWETATRAWAVGDGGVVVQIDVPPDADATANATVESDRRLTGITFAEGVGWVVGDGTALRHDETGWQDESAGLGSTFYNAVAIAGQDVVAVGMKATLAVRRLSGGDWVTRTVGGLGGTPDLNAVAGLPDGTAYLGGDTGVLLVRRPDGHVTAKGLPPLDGSVQSLTAATAGGGTRLLATTGYTPTRLSPDTTVLPGQYGQTYLLERGRWRHLGTARSPAGNTSTIGVDQTIVRDPVRAVVLDPTTGFRKGWAVGGLVSAPGADELKDIDGHARPTYSTASVWRVDTAPRPEPEPSPGESTLATLAPEGTVGFAFLGDSDCALGLCNLVEGAGGRADAMLSAALADTRRAAQDKGPVRFVLHSGDLRGLGVTDDMGQIVRVAGKGAWFSALGERDLIAQGLNVGNRTSGDVVTTAEYALSVLNDLPAPWGHGEVVPGFRPVAVSGSGTDDPSLARTHYAFDYVAGGRALLRVAVLDTSRSMVTDTASGQNPAEPQIPWLSQVLAGACVSANDPGSCIPTVVVMHRPLSSVAIADSEDKPEATALASTLANATLVLAGQQLRNRAVPAVPGTAATVVSGALGSRLSPDVPEQGGYPAWQLVTLDPVSSSLTGQPSLTVRSIPILESLALSATRGRDVQAGNTLEFTGLGRVPDAGSGVPAYLRTGNAAYEGLGGPPYIHFPFPTAPCVGQSGSHANNCVDPTDFVNPPDYRFTCEDTRICEFVRRDPVDAKKPALSNPLDPTSTIPDQKSGLMCARGAGSTYVNLVSGYLKSRVPVTIEPRADGVYPCAPPKEAAPVPSAAPSVEPTPVPCEITGTCEPPPVGDPAPVPPQVPAPEPVPAPGPVVQQPAPAPVPVPLPVPVPEPVAEPVPAPPVIPLAVPAPVIVPPPVYAPAPAPVPVVQVPVLHVPAPAPPPVVHAPPGNPAPAPPGGATVGQGAFQREKQAEGAAAQADLMVAYVSPHREPQFPVAVTWLAAMGFGVAGAAGSLSRRRGLRPAAAAPFRPYR